MDCLLYTSQEAAGCCGRCECIMDNLVNRIRNLIGKDNQNRNRYQEIQNRHSRNNLFCGLGNRLQTPEGDSCYENRDNTAYYVWAHTESNIGNIDNGVNLSKRTDTKVSNQYAEYSEQCAQRLPLDVYKRQS